METVETSSLSGSDLVAVEAVELGQQSSRVLIQVLKHIHKHHTGNVLL